MNRIASPILVAGSYIILTLLGFWLLIIPQIRETGEQKSQLKEINQRQNLALAATQKEKKDREKLQQSRTEAETLLPLIDNQFDLSVQIEAVGKSMGVSLTSLAINTADAAGIGPKTVAASKAEAAQKQAVLKKLAISLSVSGSYETIQTFVDQLVKIDRFVQIEQVSFSTSSAATNASQLSALITGFAYYMPEIKE